MKLLPNDFFNEFSKTSDISEFGKPSRDAALSHCNNFNTVIDIGAHVGISVIHWAESFKEVHAFEPMIDHYSLLLDNTKHLSNICHYNCAISNSEATLKGAYRTGKNSGSFQLLDDAYTQPSKKAPRQIYEIVSRKLDSFTFDKIDLIKVDVEGWEFEVLKGAANTIQLHRPVLLIEFTGGNSKKSLHKYDVAEYHNFMNSINYKAVVSIDDDTIYIPGEL